MILSLKHGEIWWNMVIYFLHFLNLLEKMVNFHLAANPDRFGISEEFQSGDFSMCKRCDRLWP